MRSTSPANTTDQVGTLPPPPPLLLHPASQHIQRYFYHVFLYRERGRSTLSPSLSLSSVLFSLSPFASICLTDRFCHLADSLVDFERGLKKIQPSFLVHENKTRDYSPFSLYSLDFVGFLVSGRPVLRSRVSASSQRESWFLVRPCFLASPPSSLSVESRSRAAIGCLRLGGLVHIADLLPSEFQAGRGEAALDT